MSRWNDSENGNHIEEIADMEQCRWLMNEVCCNSDCPCVADFPGEGECDACPYFEEEDGIVAI